jgi:hypothetical protein
MAASKKSKSSSKNRAAKKVMGKRPARGAARTAARPTRRTTGKGDAVKTPRKRAAPATAQPATRLATAALGREPERKPLKKAEPRPNRPPAVLPIPQSTFFF